MTTKEVIIMPEAAPGIPFSPGTPQGNPFNHCNRGGDYVFVSGQIGNLDDKGKAVRDFEGQAKQCFKNMKEVLATAGSSLADVVKTTVYILDRSDYRKMNEVYREYFTGNFPARSTIIVSGLATEDMLMEIECIAYSPKHSR
jgi:2-iminobutanoate/2-iminopropanoate deaminase